MKIKEEKISRQSQVIEKKINGKEIQAERPICEKAKECEQLRPVQRIRVFPYVWDTGWPYGQW